MIKVQDHRTSRSSAFGKSWLFGVLLLALVILAHLPATRCAFIWDDDTHLTANPCIVGPLGLKEIWTTSHARICPLVQTTFWLEYKIWGLNPMPYHLVNILFHAAACLVLWRVLLRLQVTGAWLGAALWALHPVQVTSVAWITELKNTQSGLFFLLCILFFCKSKQVGADSRQHLEDSSQCPPSSLASFHYSLSILFGALAMTSKSSTVVLPLVLGLCVWWMDGRWRWRPNLMQLTPLFLMSGLTGLVTMWTQKFEGANWEVVIPMNALERVTLAGRVLCFYLGKLLWPSHLMMVYPRWDISAPACPTFCP